MSAFDRCCLKSRRLLRALGLDLVFAGFVRRFCLVGLFRIVGDPLRSAEAT
jgi:hypothetical protein